MPNREHDEKNILYNLSSFSNYDIFIMVGPGI